MCRRLDVDGDGVRSACCDVRIWSGFRAFVESGAYFFFPKRRFGAPASLDCNGPARRLSYTDLCAFDRPPVPCRRPGVLPCTKKFYPPLQFCSVPLIRTS